MVRGEQVGDGVDHGGGAAVADGHLARRAEHLEAREAGLEERHAENGGGASAVTAGDEQVDVGWHAGEVADDDLLGGDAAGDGRSRGDDRADGPGGHLVEDRGDAGGVVGLECECDPLAAHAQVRIAHRIDEDAAVALEARGRRGAREERERGE